MSEGIYNVTLNCPACNTNIEVTKVKVGAGKATVKDADFCMHYEGVNPILYDAYVCSNCGYASMQAQFNDLKQDQRQIIADKISSKWKARSFTGERDYAAALDAYKLVLYTQNVLDRQASTLARVCHRIAWIYRYMGDVNEKVFIKHALDKYCEAYETETFPIDKLDQYTCMYLIAELNRRIGDDEKAIIWFSRIIGSPQARQNKRLMEMVRDQYQLVKQQKQQ